MYILFRSERYRDTPVDDTSNTFLVTQNGHLQRIDRRLRIRVRIQPRITSSFTYYKC